MTDIASLRTELDSLNQQLQQNTALLQELVQRGRDNVRTETPDMSRSLFDTARYLLSSLLRGAYSLFVKPFLPLAFIGLMMMLGAITESADFFFPVVFFVYIVASVLYLLTLPMRITTSGLLGGAVYTVSGIVAVSMIMEATRAPDRDSAAVRILQTALNSTLDGVQSITISVVGITRTLDFGMASRGLAASPGLAFKIIGTLFETIAGVAWATALNMTARAMNDTKAAVFEFVRNNTNVVLRDAIQDILNASMPELLRNASAYLQEVLQSTVDKYTSLHTSFQEYISQSVEGLGASLLAFQSIPQGLLTTTALARSAKEAVGDAFGSSLSSIAEAAIEFYTSNVKTGALAGSLPSFALVFVGLALYDTGLKQA